MKSVEESLAMKENKKSFFRPRDEKKKSGLNVLDPRVAQEMEFKAKED